MVAAVKLIDGFARYIRHRRKFLSPIRGGRSRALNRIKRGVWVVRNEEWKILHGIRIAVFIGRVEFNYLHASNTIPLNEPRCESLDEHVLSARQRFPIYASSDIT